MYPNKAAEGIENVYHAWFRYILAVSDHHDTAHAMELLEKVMEDVGKEAGQRYLDKVKAKDPMRKAAEVLQAFWDSYSVENRLIMNQDGTITVNVGECPVYNSNKKVGWCHDITKRLCHEVFLKHATQIVKQANPNQKLEIARYRNLKNPSCDYRFLVD